jgi:formate dehydrogenase maturation protein FdhE
MPDDDLAIRQRVRDLTSQVLEQGRVDTGAIADIVRAVTGQRAAQPQVSDAEAREVFAGAVRELDEALLNSATATHTALQQLAARGKDFTTNDLKEALASLRTLEEDYVAAADCIAEAMSGNLRREMTELAGHAQAVGAEASARAAGIMGEFASRMGESATSGLQTMRGTSIRMALLASGVLAGVADALRDRAETRKGK